MPPDLGKGLVKLSEKQLRKIAQLLSCDPVPSGNSKRGNIEKRSKSFEELSPYRQIHRTWRDQGPAMAIVFGRNKFVAKGKLQEETLIRWINAWIAGRPERRKRKAAKEEIPDRKE